MQSINKKYGSICDLVISKHLDILAFTETWLSADFYGNNTMAEILNTLKDLEFHQVPRIDRSGGGVGILLRKAFKVTRNDSILLLAMEYMDLTISHGTSSIRLVTIYRPPSLKKNHSTPEAFFTNFSMSLETLTLVSDYLFLTGDFNVHMDKENDASVNVFKDLLELAGLEQHITVPTHRSGHTLDFIINRQEDTKLSEFCVLDDLPCCFRQTSC